MEIKPGIKLKNRYEIICILGQGGFGCTYKAIDHLVNRFVAIKASENSLSHEAKILKALHNVPHISHLYDSFSEDGMHFIVMRLVKGKSLTEYQKENGGTIPIDLLKKLLPSALITLDQMHDRGIIHRDICPGNFIINEDNTLYLIDFGTATAIKESALKNLFNFNHKGLDAPEHLNATAQGAWTDVFSLCATIVYLLTGEGIPLPTDRVTYDPVPGMLLKCSLSTKMQNALIKGLSLDSSRRYQSVHAFAYDFYGRDLQSSNLEETYSVHYHARTDIGTRPVNQDNFMIDKLFAYAGEDCEIKGYIDCAADELHMVALADGVASSNHGELASKATIQAVSHFIDYYQYSEALPQNLLEDFLDQTNEKIIFLSTKLGKTASTLSILMWKNNAFFVCNIGDSPIFRLRKGKLTCLTTAHTLANTKIAKGEPVCAKDLHTLTSYLGKENIAGSQMATLHTGNIEKGDIFLICSDGISEVLTDDEKKKYMKKDGDKAMRAIFNRIQKHPNADNCTAIILKY